MKLRKHVTTLALLGLCAGLGVYVFVLDKGQATSTELRQRKESLLEVFRPSDLVSLQLERDSHSLKLICKGEHDAGGGLAFAIAPLHPGDTELPVEQPAVDKLVQVLDMATILRPVEPSLSSKDLGLDSPRARISIEMKSHRVQLLVGSEAKSPQGAVYVEVVGRGRFVVSKSVAVELLLPLESYRSATLIPYLTSECSSIQLDLGKAPKRLVSAPWGGFRLHPDGPRVDPGVFDSVAASFAIMRAERFVDNSPADAAFGKATEKLSIRLESKDPSRPAALIDVGGACPSESSDASLENASKSVLAIRREPSRVNACVPAVVLENLRATFSSIEDKHLITSRSDEVEELKLSQGDKVVELARKGSGFLLRKPEERDLSKDQSSGLIAALVALRGEIVEPQSPSSLGLAPPIGSVEVIHPASGNQERLIEKLDVGHLVPAGSSDGHVYVRRHQDGVILRLSHADARVLAPSLVAFRSIHLIDDGPEKIRRVTTVSLDGFKQTVARSPDGFKLETPQGFATDGAQAENLFDALGHLDAERWVSETDDASFGLQTPRFTVAIDIAGDKTTTTRTLLIGSPAPQGSYARWAPDSGVFILDSSVESTLANWLLDRAVFLVEPDEIDSLSVESTTRSLRFSSKDSAWQQTSDSGLADTAVAKIQASLAELRADDVSHLGAARPEEGFDSPTLRVIAKLKNGKGSARELRFAIGKAAPWRTASAYYARREGVNATYRIATSKLEGLLEALMIPKDDK